MRLTHTAASTQSSFAALVKIDGHTVARSSLAADGSAPTKSAVAVAAIAAEDAVLALGPPADNHGGLG